MPRTPKTAQTEDMPVVRPEAVHAEPVVHAEPEAEEKPVHVEPEQPGLNLAGWTDQLKRLALDAKQAYRDWSDKDENLRAAALISGRKLHELHRTSDAARLVWKDILRVLDIPERTASEHESYARSWEDAKRKIESIGGRPEAWSITSVIGLGKGKLDIEDFDPNGAKKEKPKLSKVEALKQKIEKYRSELAELETTDRPGDMPTQHNAETVRVRRGIEVRIGERVVMVTGRIVIEPEDQP